MSYSLIITHGTTGLDVTELVQKIDWRGRKGTPTRSITVSFIDDDGAKHARAGIKVEEGYQCLYSVDGKERFRGLIMKTTQSDKKTEQFVAYDLGVYLTNNKDTFCYTNKTASEIFVDVCKRFGIPTGEVSACSYRIPELTKPKTTGWDVIADALSQDFKATGIRHFVSAAGGKLSLTTRRQNILQWVIEVNQNLSSYSYVCSIEDIVTRVKMLSDEGTVLAEERNTALEKKIGIFQDVNQPDETLSSAQIKKLCKSMLSEKSTTSRTLNLKVLGLPDVISGIGVFVIIPHLGLSRTFYVDDDAHTFDRGNHTMSLKLNYASDIVKEEAPATGGGKTYAVGDIVQFHGGSHYVSSTASSPASTNLKPGAARIAHLAPGAKHPYSLIYQNWAETHVYGWVDAGTFT